MKLLAVLMLGMLAWEASCEHPIPPGRKIPHCEYYECPHYDLVYATKDYEFRKYEPTKAVGLTKLVPMYNEDWHNMYVKMLDYFGGKNDQGKVMSMTAPAGNLGQPVNATINSVTLFLYIPKSLHDNTPVPLDKELHFIVAPSAMCYVRAFSGYARMPEFARNFRALFDSIGDPTKYRQNTYLSNVYIDLLDERRNEVWALAK